MRVIFEDDAALAKADGPLRETKKQINNSTDTN